MLVDNSYKPHIDGLRAVAVISVLLFHLDLPYITGGFVGVDIFFVISGYLITGNILRSIKSDAGFSFVDFYYRRVKRIFPAMFVLLLAALILSIVLLVPSKFTLFGGTLAAAAASVANIFLFRKSGYFDIFAQSNPLLHMWSLGVEEQFYIFWPVLLFLAFKTFKNTKGIVFLLALIAIGSLAWSITKQSADAAAIFYLTQYRAFELCIGAAICWLPQIKSGKTSPILHELLCIAGLGMAVYPFFTYNQTTVFPSYNALMPTLGAALVIYLGAKTAVGRVLSLRPIVFVGLISYSLYLVHWPAIVFAKTLNEYVRYAYRLSFIEKLCVALLSFFLAYLLFRFVEVKTRNKKHASLKSKKMYIAKWIGLYLILILAGFSIYKSSGWLWRTHTNAIVKPEDLADFHEKNWGGAGFSGGEIHKGKESSPTLVMMGDSHSGMLNTGVVNQIAQPYEFTVYTVSGGGAGKHASALLLPGTTRLRNPQEFYDQSSRDAHLDVVEKMASEEQSLLMYSAAYSTQLAVVADLNDHKPWGISPGENNGSYEAYRPFIEALDRMKEKLGGRKFLLIGNFPGASKYQLHLCVAKIKWIPNPSCLAEQSRLDNKAAIEINDVLQRYAKENEGVYFINPYDALCNEATCRNLDDNGYPLYSDSAHLSKVGSDYFMALIRDQVLEIMGLSSTAQ